MLKRFLKDESGQGMVEYALIIALIAVAVIGAITVLSQGIEGNSARLQTILNKRKQPDDLVIDNHDDLGWVTY